ncbi:extracellular calcium-sensing receptor-like [Arapaima gigas]
METVYKGGPVWEVWRQKACCHHQPQRLSSNMHPAALLQALASALLWVSSQHQSCHPLGGQQNLPALVKDGDIILGGLFSLHDSALEPNLSFDSEPTPTRCTGFNFRTFRWMQTMIFAIEEINSQGHLLPNITLGYRIYDSCSTTFRALQAAMALVNEQGSCVVAPDWSTAVPVVIGDGGSSLSLVVARLLGVLHLPQVSYFSSCACLSNKEQFPTFLRTMPSDLFQVEALTLLIRRFGWTWVGAVAGDDDYGRQGVQIFVQQVEKHGTCVAFLEVIPKNPDTERMSDIVQNIRLSGVHVVLLFALEQDAVALFQVVLQQNLTGIQWLASEAWVTASVLASPQYRPVLQGSVGFAIRRADIPGLGPFLTRLQPTTAPEDPFITEFWEKTFGCTFDGDGDGPASRTHCTGSELLSGVRNIYTDVTQLRISYNVYKAVYAAAHALRAMLQCHTGTGPLPGGVCPDTSSIRSWEVTPLHSPPQRAEFTTQFRERMSFDENGDPVAAYDLINWQLSNGGVVQFVTVGRFDGTLSLSRTLEVSDQDIIWNGNQTQVPQSVCSSSCPPGSRKAIKPQHPVCCFDCVVCAAGEISSQTGEYAIECDKCPPEFWSNERRDACVPKQVEYLSFQDAMGTTLLAVALLGACCTVAVALVFVRYRNTPIVRANNSELSFLILCSLGLCFACALLFIGRPTPWSCMLRHTAFSITFSLCISCILGKTIVVLVAFRARLPGSTAMRWFGPWQQRASIFVCTLVQMLICGLWLGTAPPLPRRLLPRESPRILLLCDVGSAVAFSLVLGYIGLLAAVCFLLAFLARKLPDNFNEAKFITFSMLIFCAVWVAFVPAYVSSPGKYSTATEIFAILASSFGLLDRCVQPELRTSSAPQRFAVMNATVRAVMYAGTFRACKSAQPHP